MKPKMGITRKCRKKGQELGKRRKDKENYRNKWTT